MQSTRTFSDKIFLFLKGLAMGAANKVPGVSGGVVAFVTGFYEEFIYSLQKFNFKSFKLLFNARFKSFFQYINAKFLGILILGMVVSYFSISKLLDFLIESYELNVWSTFFGMIVGSVYYIGKDFKIRSIKTVVFIILGVVAGLSISFLKPATENDHLLFVFFCGIISVSGMTLPGLSGSFILILLGNYVLLLVDSVNALYDTLADIVKLDFSFTQDSQRIRLLQVLGSFTAGSIFGLITLSHLLNYVLKYYKKIAFSIIIGFITGSLGVVWPWKEKIFKTDPLGSLILDTSGDPILDNYSRYWPELSELSTWIGFSFIIIGILIVLGLAWYGNSKNKINYS
jgi:putative membrane protein